MKHTNSEKYFDIELQYSLSLFGGYSYICQYLEGILAEDLFLGKMLISFQIILHPIKEIKLSYIERPSNGYRHNLEQYGIYFGKDKLYKKLKEHGEQRNKYMHDFFKIINQNGLLKEKNKKIKDNLMKDLEKPIKLATKCADELDKKNKKLRKDPLLFKKIKQIGTPYKGFYNINGKDILATMKLNIEDIISKNK